MKDRSGEVWETSDGNVVLILETMVKNDYQAYHRMFDLLTGRELDWTTFEAKVDEWDSNPHRVRIV